jgi:tetratricopeptide (TPR) repeat protein
MLAPAAISAVNQWKYQPFEDAGKLVPIKTLVAVPFGGATQAQSAEVREELIFENDFWTQQDAAEAALAKGDLAQADQSLARAGDILSAHNRHGADANWQWMLTAGQVRMLQKRYEEAEKQYKNALSLSEKTWDKDAPQVGASQANLAALFAEEKRYDPAHDYASRSFATFEKNFKRVESGHSEARQVYGRAAAKDSLVMAKIARSGMMPWTLIGSVKRFSDFKNS